MKLMPKVIGIVPVKRLMVGGDVEIQALSINGGVLRSLMLAI
ncbi:hypothetical protein [Photorhabdus bodei]|uniref:Uncharacterized protein n=1 Tax=Photorhabdus bodei TaxID=2029681 RepID=A0AAW6BT31_9GAMM|nr:hypothetical protein [Photorhabdus bodei]MDB6374985.1 hypothetical protein [Photorhabdus bodei]